MNNQKLIERNLAVYKLMMRQNPGLMGFWRETHQAGEKEALTRQTINGCRVHAVTDGEAFSVVGKIENNPGLADNSVALAWLINEGWLLEGQRTIDGGKKVRVVIPAEKLLTKLEGFLNERS